MEPGEQERAKRYASLRRRAGYAKLALALGYLAFLLASGLSLTLRDWAAATANPWAQLALYLMVVSAAFGALSLPLDYLSGHALERRFGLTRQTAAGWLADYAKEGALGLAIGLLLAELTYALIRGFPASWWWLSAAAFVAVSVLLAALAPVVLLPLFYRFSPLQDEALNARLVALSERAGARVRGAYRWELSEKTRKTNAAVVGWGPTRRVIVADAMLERYSPEEVEAVFAHELGHHSRHHLWRLVGLQAAITFAAFWAVARLYGLFASWAALGGPADIAGMPLLVLIFALVMLLALPLANGYSRRLERQADEFALRLTRGPAAFVSAMRKLAEDNLAEVEPGPVVEFLFHSHPSISRRIAFAERFAATPRESPA